jgi:hypothetical protein
VQDIYHITFEMPLVFAPATNDAEEKEEKYLLLLLLFINLLNTPIFLVVYVRDKVLITLTFICLSK